MSSVFTKAVLQGLNAIELLRDADVEEGYTSTPYSAYQVAPVIGASDLVTQRTLWTLSKAGIVTVKRGPGGGYRISEEQLRTKRVKDVLEALGQTVVAPEGSRASDRLQQVFHDACDITLEEFFS